MCQNTSTKWDCRKEKWASLRLNSSIIVPKKCSEKLLGRGLPSRVLGFKSPMKILSSLYPNVSTTNNLTPRVFGCVSFVHVHSQGRGKLDPKTLKCVFVGYSFTQKGCKCYHPPKKFLVSRDVTFHEDQTYFKQPYLQGENLNETQLEILVLPSLEFTIHVPKSKQTTYISSTENVPEVDKRFEKFLVYQRRPKVTPGLIHVQEPNPIPSYQVTNFDLILQNNSVIPTFQDNNPVFQNETTIQNETETQTVENDLYLPIAFRKGTKKCTKKPLYPLLNYLSFHKFSPTQNISCQPKLYLNSHHCF
ncbi:hypothetical protein CR513_49207, partial [Mucuna pruriens]